jgi:hypothetical protein
LFIEANLTTSCSSYKIAISSCTQSSKLWITSVLFYISNSLFGSRIYFIDGIIADSFKGLEISCFC